MTVHERLLTDEERRKVVLLTSGDTMEEEEQKHKQPHFEVVTVSPAAAVTDCPAPLLQPIRLWLCVGGAS